MTGKRAYFEGWSSFKFNNLRLVPGNTCTIRKYNIASQIASQKRFRKKGSNGKLIVMWLFHKSYEYNHSAIFFTPTFLYKFANGSYQSETTWLATSIPSMTSFRSWKTVPSHTFREASKVSTIATKKCNP